MVTPYDDAPQAAGDFPGHCTYCGTLCETCVGEADQIGAPRDY